MIYLWIFILSLWDGLKLWSVLTDAIKVEKKKKIYLEKFPDAQKYMGFIIAEMQD